MIQNFVLWLSCLILLCLIITDAIQFIQPRYSQSPAELAAYAESIGRFDLTKIEQMRASKKLPDVVEPESEPKSE